MHFRTSNFIGPCYHEALLFFCFCCLFIVFSPNSVKRSESFVAPRNFAPLQISAKQQQLVPPEKLLYLPNCVSLQ